MPVIPPIRPSRERSRALLARLHNLSSADRVKWQALYDLVGQADLPTLVPLLPLLFNLKGAPYTLDNHFMMEPLFKTTMPRRLVLCCGRQVAKTQSLAALTVLLSVRIPDFNTLVIAPQFESARRFSRNYVEPLINDSPCSSLWTSGITSSNVLQRSFSNRSSIFFSYCGLSADRVRGISSSRVTFDEVQGLDDTFLPVILETCSASQWRQECYAGTPLTFDNTLQKLWDRSSRAEWVVPCARCHYDNVPRTSHDLLDMIGPLHSSISEDKPGLRCAKCKRPLNPRGGFWVHERPERADGFAGYHIPQPLCPQHYADPDQWAILLAKQQGASNYSPSAFANEVLGESCDHGSKLVSLTDLARAAVLHRNDLYEAIAASRDYDLRVLAVDWGGGGEQGTSFTCYAVLGYRSDGGIDVLYGYRSLTPHDFEREARICIDLMGKFQCSHLIHDYGGAGALREQFVINAGIPRDHVVPCAYTGPSRQDIMRHIEASESHPIDHYRIDKSRSLGLTCACIKVGIVRFFSDDYEGEDNPGVLRDFLALVEDKRDSRLGSPVYAIVSAQNQTDDFAQAVNIGCCAIWRMTGQWPDLAKASRYTIGHSVIDALRNKDPDA